MTLQTYFRGIINFILQISLEMSIQNFYKILLNACDFCIQQFL